MFYMTLRILSCLPFPMYHPRTSSSSTTGSNRSSAQLRRPLLVVPDHPFLPFQYSLFCEACAHLTTSLVCLSAHQNLAPDDAKACPTSASTPTRNPHRVRVPL